MNADRGEVDGVVDQHDGLVVQDDGTVLGVDGGDGRGDRVSGEGRSQRLDGDGGGSLRSAACLPKLLPLAAR